MIKQQKPVSLVMSYSAEVCTFLFNCVVGPTELSPILGLYYFPLKGYVTGCGASNMILSHQCVLISPEATIILTDLKVSRAIKWNAIFGDRCTAISSTLLSLIDIINEYQTTPYTSSVFSQSWYPAGCDELPLKYFKYIWDVSNHIIIYLFMTLNIYIIYINLFYVTNNQCRY